MTWLNSVIDEEQCSKDVYVDGCIQPLLKDQPSHRNLICQKHIWLTMTAFSKKQTNKQEHFSIQP